MNENIGSKIRNSDIVLTKKLILSMISEEDIFYKYLGISPEQGTFFCNPLREDESPGCNFYKSKDTERIRFRDHSRGYNWDCFDVVMFSEKVSFKEALKIIYDDFNLGAHINKRSKINSFIKPKEKSYFLVKRRKFTIQEKRFWDKYNISEEIANKFFIYGIQKVYIKTSNSIKLIYNHYGRELAFCFYLGNNEWKLYFPERREGKYSHTDGSIVQGINLIPNKHNKLVITKGYKDVVCLIQHFKIPSVAPQSENILIPDNIMTDLFNRFDNIFTLFDNDIPGKRATVKYLKKYPKLIPLLYSEFDKKDTSDNIEYHGINYVNNIIRETKKILNGKGVII